MHVRLLTVCVVAIAGLTPIAAIAGPMVNLGGVKWPDLVVSDLQTSQGNPGTTVVVFDQISFTVKEMCGAKVSKPYHVALKIAAIQGGAPLYSIVVNANPLAANGTQTWSLQLGKVFPATSYVRVDADSNNEIGKDVEGNNYAQLNPGTTPFPYGSTYCKPHKIGVVPQKP